MSSIEDLKATLSKRGGIAKANQFRVIFTPPTQSLLNLKPGVLLGQLASGTFSAKQLINDPRDIALLCQSAEIPGRQISTIDYTAEKQTVALPYNVVEPEITLKFLVTNDYYIKIMFDDWIKAIVDMDNYQVGYKKDFACDVVIQQLNLKQIPVYGVRLINAFPTTVTSIDLDQMQETAPAEMDVTLNYDRYIPEGPIGTKLSGISAALDILT